MSAGRATSDVPLPSRPMSRRDPIPDLAEPEPAAFANQHAHQAVDQVPAKQRRQSVGVSTQFSTRAAILLMLDKFFIELLVDRLLPDWRFVL